MERLYTPWRMKYVDSSLKRTEGCVFCDKLAGSPAQDRDNLLVYRGRLAFVVMNIYPYNTGHLMVLPCTHVSSLTEVPPAVQTEIMALTTYFVDLLNGLLRPDGHNIGINLGKTAGAGIDSHLHMHIVPRWSGDSNFMPVIGNTRVLPEELDATYDRIVTRLKQQPPKR